MEIPPVPEPRHLREQAQRILAANPEAVRATPHSGADPLALIYGNRLARYLWRDQGWGERLGARGWDLPGFLRTLGNKRRHFVRWVQGQIPWEEYVAILAREFTGPGGQA